MRALLKALFRRRELSHLGWEQDAAGNVVLCAVYAPLDASLPEGIGISAGNV